MTKLHQDKTTLQNWDFYQPVVTMNPRLGKYRVINVTVIGSRKYMHYVKNYYFQLGVLTTCFILVLEIEPDSQADRMAFYVTLILAAAALQITMQSGLPNLPYSTHIDKYTYASFGTLVAGMVTSTFASRVNEANQVLYDWASTG